MATTATVTYAELATRWQSARRLYPLYAAIVRQHGLGESCAEMEGRSGDPKPGAIDRVEQWLDQMDQKIEVWQLRQLLQTTHLGNEENLRAALERQLAKSTRDTRVRDKVDYLFVQYYAHCAPEDAHNLEIDYAHVADILRHFAGDVPQAPAFESKLDAILAEIEKCDSLGDLLGKKIIERSREIKDSVAAEYFEPASLVAFVRFNFLVRNNFFRLMQADLHAVRHALHAMEQRGQTYCDCSSAGMSAAEPVAGIREICHDWKKPFRAAYAAGANFKQLVAIRQAVDAAMKKPPVAAPTIATPVTHVPAVVATAAPSVAAAPPAIAAAPAQAGLIESVIQQIAAQLSNTDIKAAPVSNVSYGGAKLLLASWEVAAFRRGGNDVSDALQRAVAARALIEAAMVAKGGLANAIALAKPEAEVMKAYIARTKQAKDIDAAVNLAATQKRLLSTITEAEKGRKT